MSKTTPIRQPPGRSMAYWLIQTLVNERQQAGMMRVQIAAELLKDQSTIAKFETGPPVLPAEIDRYVAAYAKVAGIGDPRDLWLEAVNQWIQHGAVPLLTPEPAPADGQERASKRVTRHFSEAAQRQQRSPRVPPKKPNATPKRQAAG